MIFINLPFFRFKNVELTTLKKSLRKKKNGEIKNKPKLQTPKNLTEDTNFGKFSLNSFKSDFERDETEEVNFNCNSNQMVAFECYPIYPYKPTAHLLQRSIDSTFLCSIEGPRETVAHILQPNNQHFPISFFEHYNKLVKESNGGKYKVTEIPLDNYTEIEMIDQKPRISYCDESQVMQVALPVRNITNDRFDPRLALQYISCCCCNDKNICSTPSCSVDSSSSAESSEKKIVDKPLVFGLLQHPKKPKILLKSICDFKDLKTITNFEMIAS